ncbi:MAG: 2OG-Fe(II) oxygenase [Acidobacteriia bacterium]|nr:2OG-Fe(II) oxygenase [Methyloceanibacter sp.]MBX5471010.1 2OG-Fe(II) oxygenase [Acetobacteraceae bacterium]MCL6491646.1 2OG-Fe(II) oxygenase [Terriglobia bacterium]
MPMLDYAALRETPVASDPFPHLVVRRFVPPDSLKAVMKDLPRMQRRGSFPISALPLGPAARALVAEMEGPTLRSIIAERFALDLSDAATMITLRGQSTERDGLIHCDSAAKRVTVLLYLNPAQEAWEQHEGCLRLLRGPHSLEDYVVEVPPVDGTLLVFPNSSKAWHGHKQYLGTRYVLQLNYMTNDRAARAELFRHRLSALVKRASAFA